MESYRKLDETYDVIVIEGAGSPAEINLKKDGLITSDATAGEVPGNVTPCTDFESRIYMLKGKKVQEVR